VEPIRSLISRAMDEGVDLVVLADPGRPPFSRLGEFFDKDRGGEMLNWSTLQPHPIEGRILKITSIHSFLSLRVCSFRKRYSNYPGDKMKQLIIH